MTGPIAADVRRQFIESVLAGDTQKDTADRLGVSYRSAARWWKLFKSEGHVDPKYVAYETVYKTPALKRPKVVVCNDLRERLIAAVEAGESVAQAANRLAVSRATAGRWYERFKTTGEMSRQELGGDTVSRYTEMFADTILAEYQKNTGVRLIDLKRALEQQGLFLSRPRLHRFFRVRGVWLRGLGRPTKTEG